MSKLKANSNSNALPMFPKMSLNLDGISMGSGLSQVSPKMATYQIQDFTKPVGKCLPGTDVENFDLIFDTRPFNNYIESHLKNAVNICIPTTLIKRTSLTVHALLNLVNIPQHHKDLILAKLDVKNPNSSDKINLLFYDAKSSAATICMPLFQTVGKFLNFDRHFNIAILEGGFLEATNSRSASNLFLSSHSVSSDGANSLLPESSISLLSPACLSEHNDYCDFGLSGFVLPSATNNSTKFVNDIKKNLSSNSNQEVCDYKHTFKLSPGIKSLDQIDKIQNVPKWLLSILSNKSNDTIISNLNKKFSKIEQVEEARLSSLYNRDEDSKRHHLEPAVHTLSSPTICSPSGLCPRCDYVNYEIPKGIEYGFKNRYKNIWPYEHTRVKLVCESCNPIEEIDDYFNANFVDSNPVVPSRLKYIATQNPLEDTISDFWKTVNLQHIRVIISLDSSNINYLDKSNPGANPFIFKIETLSSNEHFVIRRVNDEIYHFQYLKWPDFGVPENFESIFELIKLKNEIFDNFENKEQANTILVHCLAGCGRTGVFIALDSLVDGLKVNPKLIMNSDSDLIYKLSQHQRTQRISMIQNLQQYIVVYEMFLHYLSMSNTLIKEEEKSYF